MANSGLYTLNSTSLAQRSAPSLTAVPANTPVWWTAADALWLSPHLGQYIHELAYVDLIRSKYFAENAIGCILN